MSGMLLGSYKNYSLQKLCKRYFMHADLTDCDALSFSMASVECEESFEEQILGDQLSQNHLTL